MNFKLKSLVAAAVATMTMSGAANAISFNEMFLVASVQASDGSGLRTFIAALGAAGPVNTFAGTSNLSFNYSADANWTNFITGATDVKYQVLGYYPSNFGNPGYNALDEFVVTTNNVPGPFGNVAYNTLFNNLQSSTSSINQFLQNFNVGVTGSATKYVVGGGADGIGAVNTNSFNGYTGLETTASLGTDLQFWNIARGLTPNNPTQSIRTQYLGEGVATADYWNLSTAGVLTYNTVTAVPEADTWAMMLLGLGFMGFVARRKQA